MDISTIGRQFGLNEEQTRAAFDALAPVVAAGMRRNAQSPEGLQDIFKSVLTGNRTRALEDEDAVRYDNARSSGDEILGQIFGNKDVSRGVANQLSATSGIGAAVLKKLLPIVASIVMGQVAKKMGGGTGASGGGLGDILGDILGGGRSQQQAPQTGGQGGGLGDILKDVLGGGTAEPRQAPMEQQPRSSTGNPLEDMLNDILAGGKGGVVVKQIPPDQMGDILKDIFGGQFPGGGQDTQTRRRIPDEAVTRGRRTIEDMTGGGTPQGNAADILLDSVEQAIRRR